MTAKTLHAIGDFTAERLNNSVNGNPRHQITFSGIDGELFTGKTASDYSFNYTVDNHRGKRVSIAYHVTPKGAVIVTGLTAYVTLQS